MLYSRRNESTCCFGPVGRNRRDGVKRVEPLVERPRRIAVRERDAALEFRHRDDLDRRVRQVTRFFARTKSSLRRARLRRVATTLSRAGLIGISEFQGGLDRPCCCASLGVVGHRRALSACRRAPCARSRTSRCACWLNAASARWFGFPRARAANSARTRASGRTALRRCGNRLSHSARGSCRSRPGFRRPPCAASRPRLPEFPVLASGARRVRHDQARRRG